MARRIPPERFDELVRAATAVFIERGYRQTQMADIALAIGVAKGTLYGYVESKDALFVLCLSAADERGPIPLPDVLPLPSPPPGAIRRLVEAGMARTIAQPALARALTDSARTCEQSFGLELRTVLGELFDLMEANRHRIKLLDRCLDHPELADLWQTAGREQTRAELVRYLEHRIATGHLPAIANPRLVGRIVIETCATWAVHIHWDQAPESFDPVEARATTIELLASALTRDGLALDARVDA